MPGSTAAITGSTAARGRVALFRAREDAAGSAARLRRLGFAVACLPVVEVVPLAFTPKRTRYDAVIATSAKAFAGEARLDRSPPLYVVGARTARAAEAGGWRLASPPAPDVARLVEIMNDAILPGAAVLYLAGRDRKPALESALSGALALEIVDVYAAEARERWSAAEIRALGACAVALHYSRRSAALAAALAETGGLAGGFLRMTHVCLSGDAAKPLQAIGAAHVRVADAPDEPALFSTLIEAAPLFPTRKASRI
jgi:uroporphyrinogen-III synthase